MGVVQPIFRVSADRFGIGAEAIHVVAQADFQTDARHEEVIVDVDAEFLFRQVADVADRSSDDVALAQDFGNCLGFRG